MASNPAVVGIDNLPSELLTQILSWLDIPPPSQTRLRDQPLRGMLDSDVTPLKDTSLVSKRWRLTGLPLLYRHVLWHIDRWDLLLAEQEEDPASSIPLVRFLRQHELGGAVRSLTMLVGDSSEGFYTVRRRVGEHEYLEKGRISDSERGTGAVRMVDGSNARATVFAEDNNWLWDTLFDLIDPLRFTIIASPRMLTSLLSRMLFLGDAWGFNVPYHILSLSRKDRSRAQALPDANLKSEEEGKGKEKQTEEPAVASTGSKGTQQPAPLSQCKSEKVRVPCNLFAIRPWISLLLNEGSSTRVYKTYEFFHKRPPSILGALLGAEEFPNDEPLIPPSVREMAYVGIFPLSSHFSTLVQNLPRLDRLFVQLVPRNDILHDAEEMRNVESQDLWMERNTSYSLLMREMLQMPQTGNWAHLREFESGDAADREAWEMAVQYVRLAGRGWRVGGDGVFIKRSADEAGSDISSPHSSDDLDLDELSAGYLDETDMGFTDEGPLFQGQLTRIAFNGTTTLPYSSMWLYFGDVDMDA